MSTKINAYTGAIEHSRGDDLTLNFNLSGWVFATGDNIVLSVKASSKDTAYIILQIAGAFVSGGSSALFTVSSETISEVSEGTYIYDVSLTTADGVKKTIALGKQNDIGPYKLTIKGVAHNV